MCPLLQIPASLHSAEHFWSHLWTHLLSQQCSSRESRESEVITACFRFIFHNRQDRKPTQVKFVFVYLKKNNQKNKISVLHLETTCALNPKGTVQDFKSHLYNLSYWLAENTTCGSLYQSFCVKLIFILGQVKIMNILKGAVCGIMYL